MVAKTKVGKPDLTNNADGGAIYLAQYKRAGWDYVGVIDEVGVFNKGLSADTLNDISSKDLEKPCLSLPKRDSRQPQGT